MQASREMMENLQETVTQLVYLKRDVKKIKDEMVSKEMTLASMQKVVMHCRTPLVFRDVLDIERRIMYVYVMF